MTPAVTVEPVGAVPENVVAANDAHGWATNYLHARCRPWTIAQTVMWDTPNARAVDA
jgi:hypothetical protein